MERVRETGTGREDVRRVSGRGGRQIRETDRRRRRNAGVREKKNLSTVKNF